MTSLQFFRDVHFTVLNILPCLVTALDDGAKYAANLTEILCGADIGGLRVEEFLSSVELFCFTTGLVDDLVWIDSVTFYVWGFRGGG